ncbi:MAG TPA: hypothetical protein VHG92_00975 [Afifellaceae bacterium]|nr:hypothetical protein [Afifellaceae bacterium]
MRHREFFPSPYLRNWLGSVSVESWAFAGVLLFLFLVNFILWLLAGRIDLPGFLTVRSGGIVFYNMAKTDQLGRNVIIGAVLLLTFLIGRFAGAPSWPVSTGFRPLGALSDRAVGWLFAALVFLWAVYVSYPPAISSVNFRIIWVDWENYDAKYRYVGQILRDVFYDYPQALQGLAFLTAFWSLKEIGQRIGYNVWIASILALAFCLSSVFLTFASIAEDWMLVTAAALAVFWAYSERKWIWVIAAIVVAAGLRLPEALIALVALLLTEAARAAVSIVRKPGRWKGLLALTSVRIVAVTAVSGLAAYFAYWHFARFGEGDIRYVTEPIKQLDMEGFTLTRLSGVYIGHALWTLPAIMLASCAALVLVGWRHVATPAGRTAIASALAAGGCIAFYEIFIERQFYYNFRYLAFSFTLAAPATLYMLSRLHAGWLFTAVAASTLLFSLGGSRSNVWSLSARDLSSGELALHELYSCRNVLSPWLASSYVLSYRRVGHAIQYVRGLHWGAVGFEGLHELPPEDGTFKRYESVLVNDRELREDLIRRGDLDEVTTCRGWSVFVPREVRRQ